MMKPLFSGISAVLFLLSPLQSLRAQTAPLTTTIRPSSYDAAQEIKVEGIVAAILPRPSKGMIPGSHILITGLSGPVDVSLGVFGLRGTGSLSVKPGQPVSITGVMKVLKGKEVFLARIVRVDEKVYAIRNEHGIPVSPQARERASQEYAQKGETR